MNSIELRNKYSQKRNKICAIEALLIFVGRLFWSTNLENLGMYLSIYENVYYVDRVCKIFEPKYIQYRVSIGA